MGKKLTRKQVIEAYQNMLEDACSLSGLKIRIIERLNKIGDGHLIFKADGLYQVLEDGQHIPVLFTSETHGNLHQWIQQTKQYDNTDRD